MSKTVIKAENVSKQYRLGQVGTGTLSHDLNRWWHLVRGKEDPYLKIGETNDRASRGASEYVWALRNINFEVKEGEVLGIIGKNGAGKSTLLKILSKVTGPTTGAIKAKGRIASLLEVGTGFHPELTGRENIYLNGTILGMTKAEVSRKLDEIVDFAGVARYLDTPVKRYSSGMMVRLGFAVAAHLEPEILIVDEVLAVGDAEFQRKAVGKMQEVSREGGRTVLFVSHNMASVKALCTSCMVLEDGCLGFEGETLDGVHYYQNAEFKARRRKTSWTVEEAPGNEFIKVLSFNAEPIVGKILNVDSGIRLKYIFLNKKEGINLGSTLELITKEEVIVFHKGVRISENRDSHKGVYEVSVDIPSFLLNANTYKVKVIFGENQRYMLYKNDNVYSFELENTNTGQGSNMNRVPGVIRPNLNWTVKLLDEQFTE